MFASSRPTRAGVLALALVVAVPAQPAVAVGPGQAPPPAQQELDGVTSVPGQLPVTQELAPTSRVLVRWDRPGSVAELRAGPRLEAVRDAGGPRAGFVRLTGSGAAVYDLGRKVEGPGTAVLSRLKRSPGVVSVEFDQWIQTDATLPNDPQAAAEWGLLGPANASPYGIDVLPAWDTADGSGVVVAVVDSGISTAHPDLLGQSVPGYDLIDRDADATDTGDCTGSHGTLVTGPIAAIADNGQGVFGGAPGAKVQPVRVSACGFGFSSDGADGIRWAAGGTVPGIPVNPTPAAIINASFGVPYATSCLPEFASAIADARARGALVVVAAGNFDLEAATMSPGNCDGVLNVGAIDNDGRRSSFSNYGARLDLSAPGNAIWTTARPDGYTLASGTSLAAPIAAAAAALVKSAHPSLDHDALELVLTASALPPATHAAETGCASRGCGAGIVNAARAMQRLAPAEPPVTGMLATSRSYPLPGQSFSVRALAVDGVAVAGGELRIDDGPWQAMSAADGAFGSSREWLQGTAVAPTTEAPHTVCVRADDGTSEPGPQGCTEILVDAALPTATAPTLSTSSASGGTGITFTTTVADANGVQGAEYSIDGGPWIAMRPADDTWGGTSEATGSTVNERVAQMAVGANSCVLMESGTVRCWGQNYFGAVGDGTFLNRSVPVELDLQDVTHIGSGLGHACAVLEDATVRCWGANIHGELGDGTFKYRGSPVHVLGLTDVAAVAPGPFHTCALRTDATVSCWGPALGLGDGTEPPTDRPEAGPVPDLSGVTQLVSGGNNFGSSCALLAGGTVRCWGDNGYGNFGDGSTTQQWVPVTVAGLSGVQSLSGMHTCATLLDESVKCWGFNFSGQLGDGTTIARLAPVTMTILPEVEAIASGQSHKCAIVPDRTVRCWGNNLEGQLGDGSQDDSMLPRTPIGLSNVADIRAGWDRTCALRTDGSVWCWGENSLGHLGDGSTGLRLQPVRVAGLGALAQGPHTVCVRGTDVAQRTSNGAACSSLTIVDTTAPSAAIKRPGAVIGQTSTFRVTFDEPVTGLALPDFSLAGTAAATCAATALTGSGASYALTVTCNAGGTLTVSLAADSVTDAVDLTGPAAPVTTALVTVDRAAPTTTVPRHSLPMDTTVKADSIPVSLSWSGADAGAGVKYYQVRVRTDGGAWRTVAPKTSATTLRMFLATGHTHQLSVRAVDKVGNVGAWANGSWIRLTARQDSHSSIGYAGSWRTVSGNFWAGSARSTTTAGSRATVTFTGRSIAVVASRRPDSGWIRILLDGKLVAEVDLRADTVRYRSVVWTRNWKSSAEHTIVIRVLDSGTRLDLDAIVTAS